MNAQEGVSLAKMAVVCTLIVLVLSALLSLFYFMYTQVSKKSTEMQQTITTSTTDKLSDLCNASNSGEYPWVSSVINAITEMDDPNLLYVHVIDKNTTPDTIYFFTYENITITGAATTQIKQCQSPLDECSKYLLGRSNKRCVVQYLENNTPNNASTLPFDCLQITVLE